ncbi:MAG: YheU family protein [Granulosicoccus sp.]|nr:YheU family protein [Granulosicoccus sp.]
MNIPWDSLDSETLVRLLTEIVTRDGTDYGAREISTEAKVASAQQALTSGRAMLYWDDETETASLIPTEQVKQEENRVNDLRKKIGIDS